MARRQLIFLLLLLLALQRVDSLAQVAPDGMVLVPAGWFVMGSRDGHADEAPVHRVRLSAFYIDRHEVTNEEFAAFVRKSGRYAEIEGPWFRYYAPGCRDLIRHIEQKEERSQADESRRRAAAGALRSLPEKGGARLPVRGVTWRDAVAYARWAGKRLPTEAEWEKAARGADERPYPWGETWDSRKCRAGLAVAAGPAPVGSHSQGAGPYGCLDVAGNVWEWVADWYGETYYASSSKVDPKGPAGLADGRLPAPSATVDLLRTARQGRESDTRKVVRGGAWAGPAAQARFNARTTRRMWSNPNYWHPDVGFRCAKDVTG